MQQYLNQANHNQKFHDCINSEFPGHFCDWKITVLFYIAIHYLKALAAKKNFEIGETHFEIEHSVNPDRLNSKMKISRSAWRDYKNLFNYSRTSRYEGITDSATFETLKQIDHSFCIIHLDNFRKYVQSNGVNV